LRGSSGTKLKAATTNTNSICFHKALGMEAEVVKSYAGPGEDKERVVSPSGGQY
jgi:hypothetical protein